MYALYYSGFFEKTLPMQMVELLRDDITCKKSIVVITGFGKWTAEEKDDLYFAKETWFDPIGIVFDEYHLIDANIPKEKAHMLLRNASVILLQGGFTTLQNAFLSEYELEKPIKETVAPVIMGVSAGARNMSAKVVCMKSNGHTSEENGIYNGLTLSNFCYEPYFSLDNDELIKNELLPLSQELNVYATANGSFMRVQDGEVLAFGCSYLISDSTIHKL